MIDLNGSVFAGNVRVVAFLQDRKTRHVVGLATATPLADTQRGTPPASK